MTTSPTHDLECPLCFRTVYWCQGHGRGQQEDVAEDWTWDSRDED